MPRRSAAESARRQTANRAYLVTGTPTRRRKRSTEGLTLQWAISTFSLGAWKPPFPSCHLGALFAERRFPFRRWSTYEQFLNAGNAERRLACQIRHGSARRYGASIVSS